MLVPNKNIKISNIGKDVCVGIKEKNIAPNGTPIIKYGILLPNLVRVLSEIDPIIGWIMTPIILSKAINNPIKKKEVKYVPNNKGTCAL
jgi:hypothetical protein